MAVDARLENSRQDKQTIMDTIRVPTCFRISTVPDITHLPPHGNSHNAIKHTVYTQIIT